VTGASGFLATNLVQRLASLECRLILLHRASSALWRITDARAEISDVHGDVAEAATWQNLPAVPDVVFHFAAQTSVYAADADPVADWRANVLPMVRLLETCRERQWRPAILFAGSATQFGLPARIPVDETLPDRPVTIYDCHKIAAEGYLAHYIARGLVHGCTLRLANIYGPGPKGSAPDRGILNQMIRRALRGEVVTLYGDGGQVRDYLFIADAIDAFLVAAENIARVDGAHFVLGSGTGHTLADAFQMVAARVGRLAGRPVDLVRVAPPAGLSPIEQRSFVADTARFQAATGWTPRVALGEGIDRTAGFFAANDIVSK
jgi:nucleoside-diphosphate-sugar epimerase